MKRNIEIVIDLKNKTYNTIFLKQMDTTMFTIKILDDNVVTNLNGQTVDIIFTKPDNKIVQQVASNIDKENGIAIIPLKENCVRQSGKAKMEVEVKNTNSEVVSSFYIPVQIEKTSKENVESDNIPNYFEEFSKAIDNLKHNSDEMLKDISVAEEQRLEAEKSRTDRFNQIVKELDLTKYEERLDALENTQNAKINKLQKDFTQKRYYLTLEEDLRDNSELTIPCNYCVGNNSLKVYFEGELLELNVHYKEIGEERSISNKIKIENWGDIIDTGLSFSFEVVGTYESEVSEE